MAKWQKKGSKKEYGNKWVKIYLDQVVRPDGKNGEYTVIETDTIVTVIALTKDNKVILIRLERYPIGQESWEIVKGRSDGEELVLAAIRELQEETGYTAEHWEEGGKFYPLNGICSEINHVFLAKGLKQTNIERQKEEGIIEVKDFSWKEIEEMIEKGKITDGQSIASLYKVKLRLEKK